MKNEGKIKIWIIVSIIVILCVAVIVILLIGNKGNSTNELASFEYDVLIEEHRHQYEGVPDVLVPAGGYSTTYYYTVINSEEKEKYVVAYQDVWDIHNERGDLDTVTVNVEELTDSEIENAINQYGKNEKKSNLQDLIEKEVDEKYTIRINQ